MKKKNIATVVFGFLMGGSTFFLCAMDDQPGGELLDEDSRILFMATCVGDAKGELSALFARNPDIIHKIIHDNTNLARAILCRQEEVVMLLIGAQADVNEVDDKGNSLLHQASGVSAHVGIARELIRAKIDVNLKNKRGDTPLHTAAGWARVEVAEVLIQQGASLEAKNRHKDTPLAVARLSIEQNKQEMIRLLSAAAQNQGSVSGNSPEKKKGPCVVS